VINTRVLDEPIASSAEDQRAAYEEEDTCMSYIPCIQRRGIASSLGGGYMSYAEEDTCHIYEPIALTTAFVEQPRRRIHVI
jgi:hypothetical protein